MEDQLKPLEHIAEQVRVCTLCRLCESRTKAVPGSGNSQAKILFIGEGPGRDEDLQGEPFVGAAGKFLSQLLESINLKRQDVFITNVVKCRPPNNRDPEPDEVASCWPYLDAQIKLIQPLVIVTLGRHSMGRFLPGFKISEIHGQAKRIKGFYSEKQVIYPVYHPAAALYNSNLKQTLFDDFQKIPVLLKQLLSEQK